MHKWCRVIRMPDSIVSRGSIDRSLSWYESAHRRYLTLCHSLLSSLIPFLYQRPYLKIPSSHFNSLSQLRLPCWIYNLILILYYSLLLSIWTTVKHQTRQGHKAKDRMTADPGQRPSGKRLSRTLALSPGRGALGRLQVDLMTRTGFNILPSVICLRRGSRVDL